ncbi:MAG: hypothetical protein IJE43_15940 [Alphaproteobacteria bacterium]|nr:hypothetical protein [Alphaproteobacteria bacterium]
MSIVHYKHRESPIEVDTFIKKEREKNGGFITPYIANNVLEMTNHFACIKVVIKEINKLDKNKKMEFEDFVYNAIAGREHSNDAYAGLKKLAIECGWEEGFNSADKLPKCYDVYGDYFYEITNELASLHGDYSKYDKIKSIKRINDFYAISGYMREEPILPLDCDFSLIEKLRIVSTPSSKQERYKKIKFKDGGTISLRLYDKVPKKLEFNRAWVYLEHTDLSIVDDLAFNDCEKVRFNRCVLPQNLDVSSVKELNFFNISKEIDKLEIPCCDTIVFEDCDNIADGFDFFGCNNIRFTGCKLSNFSSFKFKDGANIMFDSCTKIPNDLDMSAFSKVHFFYVCDDQLLNSDIKFRDGSTIIFEASKMPIEVDFSKCGEIQLIDMEIKHMIETREFKFKNKEQYEQIAEDMKGNISAQSMIVFADENVSCNYRNLGFER